ncbi:ABC transporter ATP-binding protein [Oceaniglobus trochenteri]|uniref:ABC transporter ATP-binding protein n=1 Tax=Oceaniglobus trochenteri TaxID=2763260 RepID=UPI001CFFCA5D|nr:oligopeptide/dipeptide ABC transporter ATP-binding protein [Oceaniglobus trochenteri]
MTVKTGKTLMEVRNLKMHFPITKGFFKRTIGHVKAVDDVSFDIIEGETLGVVGESGCGKTTTGRCLMRILQPTSGEILYRREDGEVVDLTSLSSRDLKPYRRDIRMIFQDPQSSLNPRMPVVELVGEAMRLNGIAEGKELEDRVAELLKKVGLRPEYMRRFPHAFSGGERQRIGIARALSLNPRLVVADEAVSALDVSVQAQTLNLMQDLQDEFKLTYVFVAHDLSVVEHIADRIAVMYVGKLVEICSTEALFDRPMHPYTAALLSAVPKPDPRLRGKGSRTRLTGEVADPSNPPPGCPFHPRCSFATDLCKTDVPPLRRVEDGHMAACHYAGDLPIKGVAALAG